MQLFPEVPVGPRFTGNGNSLVPNHVNAAFPWGASWNTRPWCTSVHFGCTSIALFGSLWLPWPRLPIRTLVQHCVLAPMLRNPFSVLRFRVDRPISAILVLVLRLLREFRFLDVYAVLLLTRRTTWLIERSFYTSGPCLFGTERGVRRV